MTSSNSTSVSAYAAKNAHSPLAPFQVERRAPTANDVVIDIMYCGVCHSDIHQARDEWGGSIFPMVPGHEIVGKVTHVGSAVKRFQVGDSAGVGCMVDACRTCPSCKEGLEQYCENGFVGTYNALERDKKTPTYGGYSTSIVVNQDFVLSIDSSLSLAGAAPLLCAGITTYSPLRHWKAGPGTKLAVMGLGGLGHMAVKLGAAMGAEVTVISSSERKREDAMRLGAKNFVASNNRENLKPFSQKFDLIINTVSSIHGLSDFLELVKRDGTMVVVGAPDKPDQMHPFPLIMKRRQLAGSLIGGIKETQEMLDFCASKGITSDVEVIPMNKINEAFERITKSDVKYRFVIDLNTLRQ